MNKLVWWNEWSNEKLDGIADKFGKICNEKNFEKNTSQNTRQNVSNKETSKYHISKSDISEKMCDMTIICGWKKVYTSESVLTNQDPCSENENRKNLTSKYDLSEKIGITHQNMWNPSGSDIWRHEMGPPEMLIFFFIFGFRSIPHAPKCPIDTMGGPDALDDVCGG